ncbi:thioesterase family protein [Granulosicoccus sp. 3-233]|uniref:thioesterase family protein n=1 Tax=Granulosicoccus sp. 3-233 TaxID=3417969 RepID=UPI003D33694B
MVSPISDQAGDAGGPQLRSGEEQQRLLDDITTLFEHRISFNEFLGFRIQQLDPGPIRIGFQMRPELIGHYLFGRLHGGVISSVLDVTGGLAVMMGIAGFHKEENSEQILQRFSRLATIDLRVDYLRQGIGKEFLAEAEVVRLGRRVAVCSMRLRNDEQTLIATGNANYIVS